MKVVVSGSSGLIGSTLVASLRADGHDVVTLVRRTPTAAGQVQWDPSLGASGVTPELRAALDGAGAVVNLAGAGVAEKRWDDAWKREILDSRVGATTCLATAITDVASKPPVFVSGSASGYYGDTGPVAVDESSPSGRTFLAQVCTSWELAAEPAREVGVRVVHPRTGTVADADGGAFGRWLPIFKLGGGGPLGSGKQWWSLISLTDEVRGIRHAIDTESLVGPANFAAPEQITNGDLAKALGRALSRPSLVPAPLFGLKLVLGDFAEELVISQRMAPNALLASGFEFAHPTIDAIVADMLD
ncbi:MAG: TIGR01777 family oxidoreductase [Candidatus Nanopelagicales bacterium]